MAMLGGLNNTLGLINVVWFKKVLLTALDTFGV